MNESSNFLNNENDISKLKYILYKYNEILSEYQKKFGNELFNKLENELSNMNNQKENNETLKKYLIENISIFREYEKNILDKNQQIEYLTTELNKQQKDFQKIIEENEELRTELENTKQTNQDLYNTILDRKKLINFKEGNSPEQNEDTVNVEFNENNQPSGNYNQLEILKQEKNKLLNINIYYKIK